MFIYNTWLAWDPNTCRTCNPSPHECCDGVWQATLFHRKSASTSSFNMKTFPCEPSPKDLEIHRIAWNSIRDNGFYHIVSYHLRWWNSICDCLEHLLVVYDSNHTYTDTSICDMIFHMPRPGRAPVLPGRFHSCAWVLGQCRTARYFAVDINI